MTSASLLPIAFCIFAQMQSEGPLEIKDLTAPQDAVLHEPVEISFALSGSWSNPFDPRQVSVSASVVGSRNLFATVYGFYDQQYRLVASEEGETLVEDGPPVWRIRYAPWNTGTYSIAIRILDVHRRLDHPSFAVRTGGRPPEMRETGGFVEVRQNAQYLRVGDRSFYPVGINLKDTEATEGVLRRIADSGANAVRLLLSPEGWAINGRGRLGEFDLRNAWRLERFLDAARRHGVHVLLSLNDGRELQEGWAGNPFNRANGGTIENAEDFWTDQAARIQYKRQLRYIVSRFSDNSFLMGIEFWRGIEAPDYWIMEMGNEVYDMHPFAVVITTQGTDDSLVRTERQRTMSMPLPEGLQDAVGAVERVRRVSVKPVLAVTPERHNPWRKMIAGSAGVFVGGLADLDAASALGRFTSSIDWRDRNMQHRQAALSVAQVTRPPSDGTIGWALIDDRGGPLYLEASDENGVAAGIATVSIRRGGIYTYRWINPADGNVVLEGEVRDVRGELPVPYPAFRGALACNLIRR